LRAWIGEPFTGAGATARSCEIRADPCAGVNGAQTIGEEFADP
jgi:hypothetical protein